MISVLIVGCGNMGSSLARGLAASAHKDNMKVQVIDQHAAKLVEVEKLGIKTLKEWPAAISEDVIVLCVKPQDLLSVSEKMSGKIGAKTLVISILAGTLMEDVSSLLKFEGAVVRAMPNIPAVVRCAATAMCANEECNDKQRSYAELIFNSVGESAWTEESLLDAVTGLSGSGPAYIYMVIEALTDGGVKMGIPRDLASKLAVQTVLGAAQMVKTSGQHPAILKDQVTTPGGTTIFAVHELENRGLRPMLISAVVTATEKSALLRDKAKSGKAKK